MRLSYFYYIRLNKYYDKYIVDTNRIFSGVHHFLFDFVINSVINISFIEDLKVKFCVYFDNKMDIWYPFITYAKYIIFWLFIYCPFETFYTINFHLFYCMINRAFKINHYSTIIICSIHTEFRNFHMGLYILMGLTYTWYYYFDYFAKFTNLHHSLNLSLCFHESYIYFYMIQDG